MVALELLIQSVLVYFLFVGIFQPEPKWRINRPAVRRTSFKPRLEQLAVFVVPVNRAVKKQQDKQRFF